MINYKRLLLLLFSLILIFIFTVFILGRNKPPLEFNAERAYQDVAYQLSLGPRTMGSEAHNQVADWIINSLREQGWQVDTQETFLSGNKVKNIIAKRGVGTPWVILGSHYDSRTLADQDPDTANRKLPVMGANDGASSVAILLELARVIPKNINRQIWLVFFDNEDNGTASGNGWVIGSSYFVSQLEGMPDSVVILDMVGDKDLNIYMERNSSPQLNDEIWSTARNLGYSQFIASYKYGLIDDHIPFIQAGISATDIIDFDYPYWHTTQDTLDNISANSLRVVGETILTWLNEYPKLLTLDKLEK
jgi:glutaminyl-peptide cyclotransferase